MKKYYEINNEFVEIGHLLDPALWYLCFTIVPDLANTNTKKHTTRGQMSVSTLRKVILYRKNLCSSFGIRRKNLRFEINILETFQR